jgi:hypothetical protein
MVIWYISPRFGMLSHENSGKPALNPQSSIRQAPLDGRKDVLTSLLKKALMKRVSIYRHQLENRSSSAPGLSQHFGQRSKAVAVHCHTVCCIVSTCARYKSPFSENVRLGVIYVCLDTITMKL